MWAAFNTLMAGLFSPIGFKPATFYPLIWIVLGSI